MLDGAPLHSFAHEIVVERLPQLLRNPYLYRIELSQHPGISVMIVLTEFALQFSFDLRDFFRQAVSQQEVIRRPAFRRRRQKDLKASRSREFFQTDPHEVFIQLLSNHVADGVASAGKLEAGRSQVETGDAHTITQAITGQAAFLRQNNFVLTLFLKLM